MEKKKRGSSRHGTVRKKDFDFHSDKIMIDADEYKEAIEWIGNEIAYYSGNGDVTEDKTFLPWFEYLAKESLHAVGFKRDALEDKEKLDKSINLLRFQGMISSNCGRIPLQNGFPPGTFTTTEDNLTFRVNNRIEAALRTLKTIEVLRPLLVNDGVVNKESMKVCLRTIELMINQIRAGYIGGLATQQIEGIEKGAEGGKKSGKGRREKAELTKEAWQEEADKIWRKHPTWSKRQIATEVEKRIGGNPDTIRKSIIKPLP